MDRLAKIFDFSVVLVLAAFVGVPPVVAQSWHDLSPGERYDALQKYQEHRALPKDRRHAIENDYQRWRTMPPAERDRVRQNYQRYQRMPPEERQRFERKYEKWRHDSHDGHDGE